jgi:hypothetical protein
MSACEALDTSSAIAMMWRPRSPRRLGSARYRVIGGARTTVTVRLKRSARMLLRKRARLRVAVMLREAGASERLAGRIIVRPWTDGVRSKY